MKYLTSLIGKYGQDGFSAADSYPVRQAARQIEVEVVYALPERQTLLRVALREGATAAEAIHSSGILEQHPEIDPGGANRIGVFGRAVKPAQVLRDGDRVEIYRPLIADPKAVRKERAAAGKAMKKGSQFTPP